MDDLLNLVNQIYKSAMLVEKAGNQLIKPLKVTVKKYVILTLIKEGHTKTTQLAQYIQGSLANVTQKTKVLEKEGLIKRKLDKNDRRIWHFTLTKKGEDIYRKVFQLRIKSMEDLHKLLSKDEILKTLSTMTKIEKNYSSKIE